MHAHQKVHGHKQASLLTHQHDQVLSSPPRHESTLVLYLL